MSSGEGEDKAPGKKFFLSLKFDLLDSDPQTEIYNSII